MADPDGLFHSCILGEMRGAQVGIMEWAMVGAILIIIHTVTVIHLITLLLTIQIMEVIIRGSIMENVRHDIQQ